MSSHEYPLTWYQWGYRPKDIRWPSWFKSWPGGARVAVQIDILHEFEINPRPATLPGRPMPQNPTYPTDYMALTAREYGFKFGVWRLMDMLDRQGVKATVFCNGISAELFPESTGELKARGHEIAVHQFDQAVHPPVYKSREEELSLLRRSVAAIEKASGEKPKGYMSPGPRPSPHTLELVAEQGFIWDGDYYDSDIPYIINVGGKYLVSLPYCRPGYIDAEILNFFSGNPQGPGPALEMLKYEFDAVYEESERHPMRFSFAMHTYISGRPGATRMFEEFICYMKKHAGVWFARGIDQANYWLENEAASVI